MDIRQIAVHWSGYTDEPDRRRTAERDTVRGGRINQLAQRFGLVKDWLRPGDGEPTEPDHELIAFARGQIERLDRTDEVDLANPLSITADANEGWVRVEFVRAGIGAHTDAGLLAELIRRIAPALFATGRVTQLDVGLVEASVRERPPGERDGATRWAIARPGDI